MDADPKGVDEHKDGPLRVAAGPGQKDILCLFLDSGANVEAPARRSTLPRLHEEATKISLRSYQTEGRLSTGGWSSGSFP